MKECKKVCRQMHLPLQSGSDKVLKDMNRRYTKEQYLEKIELLKREIPGISLSTDIIVGFPTEDNEDFEETLDVLRRVEYDNIFSFNILDMEKRYCILIDNNSLFKIT